MQLWEKILQMALLGSERTHLEQPVEESLRHYGIDPEDPLPQVVLTSAATLHQLRKVGILTKPFGKPLPEPAADEAQHQTLQSRSLIHLRQILSGRYRRVLKEYVQLLAAKQKLLPPEFLPELLDECLQDRELWQAIQPLLGHRAIWLIAQRPEWNLLAPREDPTRWSTAGPEARKQILAYIRNNLPQDGIPLLKSIWEDIDFKQKLALLDLLETGLGVQDESFLESCLEDSRKEVRLKAADLLAQIPESRLTGRLFKQVIPLFIYDASSRRLEVDLPKEIPEETLKDGVQPKVEKGKNGGLKVSWLAECVARIPVQYWTTHFDWTLEELISRFERSNRSNLLLTALGKAGLRFQDITLSVHLIRHLVLKNGLKPDGLDFQALAKQVPANDLQGIAHEYLQRQPGLLEEQHLLTKILELGVHPWSIPIARRIVQDLKQWMAESKTFHWNLWHYKRLLEIAGYCSPIELFDNFDADWPVNSPVWNQWAPDVERMLQIMRFRIEMKEE